MAPSETKLETPDMWSWKRQPKRAEQKQVVGHDFVKWEAFGVCPDCGSLEWHEGPMGGSCINFKCAGCHARFNVAMPPLKMIQRI